MMHDDRNLIDDELDETTLREAADDVERTIVVDRGSDDDAERTILVDRGSDDDAERTILVDRGSDDDAERTILVDRRPDDEAERTILVDRGGDADDATVVRRSTDDDDDDTDRTVARPGADAPEHTVVVPRRHAAGDEDTVVVGRGRVPRVPVAPSLRTPAGTGRRRGIAPPPVPAGFAPPAQLAKGPGAIDTYTPRDIPAPPATVVAPSGATATRGDSTRLPSVARRARRTGVVAVAVFAAVCVASVTGLAFLITSLL